MSHVEVPYCPVAASAEVLGDYWTLLIVRELLGGETHFNELVRSLPGISRTVLTQRLRALERSHVVARQQAGPGRPAAYRLTTGGRELGAVIDVLAEWGLRFALPDPRAEDLDPDVLMWLLRGRLNRGARPSRRVVVEVVVAGGRGGRYWWVIEPTDVSLCVDNPGLEVDLFVEAHVLALYDIWLHRSSMADAVRAGRVEVDGLGPVARAFPTWFDAPVVGEEAPVERLEEAAAV